MKRRLQPSDPRAQHAPRTIDSPYLTAHEAVVYLRLGSLNALYRLIKEWGMPYQRRGRVYLFDRRRLDLWLEARGPVSQLKSA